MTAIHQRIAEGRWQTMSLPEQLGNALDLLDLTLADGRWTGRRRREIARAREVLCADYLARDEAALRSLDRYFTAFALLARRDR